MMKEKSLLRIEGLGKRFASDQGRDVAALLDVNLSVKENEFVCIVGPSGCGKSTLLRILAGLERPSGGRALMKGVEIEGKFVDRKSVV